MNYQEGSMDVRDMAEARRLITQLRADIKRYQTVGMASAMPGTGEGFTMVVFNGSEVPVGTKVYVRKA